MAAMDGPTRTALITGASGGIGEALAREAAAAGMNVVLVARSEDKLKSLADELSSDHGIDALAVGLDLSDPAAPDGLAERLGSEGFAIDVLINNAGYGTSGAFVDAAVEGELNQIQLNVTTLTHLTRLFLPSMVERGWGRVMNVASTAAFQPGPLMAVYYATKAYVLHLSEALSEELKGSGVTVTALCPGPTPTGFQDRAGVDGIPLLKLLPLPSSEDVARAGFKAMMAGRAIYVYGVMNKAGVQLVRVSPRAMARKVVKRLHRHP